MIASGAINYKKCSVCFSPGGEQVVGCVTMAVFNSCLIVLPVLAGSGNRGPSCTVTQGAF